MGKKIIDSWSGPREVHATEIVNPVNLSDETILKLAKAIAEELRKQIKENN